MEEEMKSYKNLCIYCFDVLLNHLKNLKKEIAFPEEFRGKSYPLFVTWSIGKEKELRGCIGTFAEEKLEKNLMRYTLISALRDDRFMPISLKEVKDLHVGVSLLTNFEKVDDPFDWVVGKHGIEIDFEHKNKSYSGTFLPEVAEEQGWNQTETLKYLVEKAGYYGKFDYVIDKIKTKRYQSIKVFLSYEEYIKFVSNI